MRFPEQKDFPLIDKSAQSNTGQKISNIPPSLNLKGSSILLRQAEYNHEKFYNKKCCQKKKTQINLNTLLVSNFVGQLKQRAERDLFSRFNIFKRKNVIKVIYIYTLLVRVC